MDHNKRVFQNTLVFIALLYPSIVICLNTNITQDNGMNIVGEEVGYKTSGIENKNENKKGPPLVKREQLILRNASKSANLNTDQIEERVSTWLPSVFGVLMTGVIFSILILKLLMKKHNNETFHPEDENLPLQQ